MAMLLLTLFDRNNGNVHSQRINTISESTSHEEEVLRWINEHGNRMCSCGHHQADLELWSVRGLKLGL